MPFIDHLPQGRWCGRLPSHHAAIERRPFLGSHSSRYRRRPRPPRSRGSVQRTLETVHDRLWLEKQTRMRQFRSLVAANRYETREDGLQQLSAYRTAMRAHESDEDLDMDASDFEEEEEEDPEIEQRPLEDHSAKNMASGDWARNRILDVRPMGNPVRSMDLWYDARDILRRTSLSVDAWRRGRQW
ncbi:hypothetical protein F5146DRAFT_251403 [Armillaria mellea]|nr:hypothetical protein F5146DRAFT_251403 [Armillaria mellea]